MQKFEGTEPKKSIVSDAQLQEKWHNSKKGETWIMAAMKLPVFCLCCGKNNTFLPAKLTARW